MRKTLEGLLEQMLDPCAVYDPVYEDGELVDLVRTVLNQAGRRMLTALGVDPAETSMRRNVPDLVASDVFRRYAEVLRTGTAWSGRDVAHDGDRLAGVYDIQAWPVSDGLAITWRQVTDRDRALEQLRASEHRFRATVDQLPDAVSVFEAVRDDDGEVVDFRWVYCNSYNAEMTGYRVEELVGQRLLTVFPEQGPAGMIDVYAGVVSTGESWEQATVWYEDEWGDGTRRRRAFDVRASKVGDGFVVVSRDVTDLRLQAEELLTTKDELHEAQHLARLGSWTEDLTTGAADWSPELFEILRVTPEECVPGLKALIDLAHPEDARRVEHALEEALARGSGFDVTYRVGERGQSVRHVRGRGEFVLDETGRPTVARGTLLDETEVIAVSEALTESNKRLERSNQSLNDLIGIIGHDLRSPLTAAMGYLALAEEQLDDLDEAQRAGIEQLLGRTRGAAVRVEDMLKRILDMSRVDVGALTCRPERVGLRHVVARVLEQRTSSVPVETVGLDGVVVTADPTYLTQVLDNLLSNAEKYGAPPITVTAETYAGRVRVTVSDDGAGVPPEFLPRLFERFSRAQPAGHPAAVPGTGLGLHLSRELCRAMGGELTYEPATSGFVVHLPAGPSMV